MFTNLRFTIRQLAKNPGFTALALLTLALGIAGNFVIFTVFNALYLRPLPFKDPGQLLNLDEVAPKWNLEYTGVNFDDFHDWQTQNRTFDGMAVWSSESFNLSNQGHSERVDGGSITFDLLDVLGVRPILGRGFLKEEDAPGQTQVVLLGNRLWKRQWAGDPNVLGKTISIDSVPHTIVGVLPSDVGPLSRAQLFVPAALALNAGRGWYLDGVGRLKKGVSIDAAREDLTRIHKAAIPNRDVNGITSPRLTPFRERLLGNYRSATYILMAAVGIVWLIACANVAGLMLARGLTRNREIGIRLALGASAGTVIRQVLLECSVLSTAGGLAGVMLGELCLHALVKSLPSDFPSWLSFDVDTRFLAFYLITTFVTAGVFGLTPAIKMVSSASVQGALQSTSQRTTGSASQRRSLNMLVAGEIALALVLLINAGLLIKAFQEIERGDPGFRAENTLTYKIALPDVKYTDEQAEAFFREHLTRIRALPGVKAASATSIVPLDGHSGNFFAIEDAPPKPKEAPDPVVLQQLTFPDYANAIGLNLVAGRYLEETETTTNTMWAVVVNESFARSAWPHQSALGKRIRFPGGNAPWIPVLGVVRDVKHYGFDQPVRPSVFLPYRLQRRHEMTIVARTLTDPKTMVSAIHDLLGKQDSELPMFDVRTMFDRVQASLWLRRSYSRLFGFFSVVALCLCLGGIYGVISYTVSQRTGEIGLRIALGAQRRDVRRLVLGQWLKLAGTGIGIGLIFAFALSRLMKNLLPETIPGSTAIYAAVAVLLGVASLLACLNPSRRATRVDPMVALRCE